jgi:hypothetical protein
MMQPILICLAALVVAVPVILLAGRPVLRKLQRRQAERAIDLFRLQREQLEAKFFDLARAQGRPRDLRWLDCDWQSGVTFGRDVESGMLTAFVSVYISFEAVEGGDMEDVEAVGLLRDAAALFHFTNGCWGTGGRALFNMNSSDALQRLTDQYEPVELPV